ncbi:hypothetical protein UAJ10_22840 [Nitrospirillum sp. BR 11164]|uniref:hypothetical protein n=1 Tax=Nitrospirillum sp. BR 11164 TaxID=3104324 RepID=UPI002B0005DF|nr:hypothetical protein [Nitrospirillum sp. BR 11164]MEA1651838.1 hypothetical protein [Nitrospirillum sp. BR 11164]
MSKFTVVTLIGTLFLVGATHMARAEIPANILKGMIGGGDKIQECVDHNKDVGKVDTCFMMTEMAVNNLYYKNKGGNNEIESKLGSFGAALMAAMWSDYLFKCSDNILSGKEATGFCLGTMKLRVAWINMIQNEFNLNDRDVSKFCQSYFSKLDENRFNGMKKAYTSK